MDLTVKNVVDLQSEILRLEALKQNQEIVLKQRFSSPKAILASVKTLFPQSSDSSGAPASAVSSLFSQDMLGLISRFVLPIALNKTLFKNSGFIIKTVVGILSQKASSYISEDSVTSVWGRVKSVFTKNPKNAIVPATVKPSKTL